MKFKLAIALLLFPLFLFAQPEPVQYPANFSEQQHKLAHQMRVFMMAYKSEHRLNASHNFIKELVSTLKTDGSYNFKFDSLAYVSVLTAPDNAFKIFSWQVELDSGEYRHFGVIQMNSVKLKIYPLIDDSERFPTVVDTSFSNKNWIGAAYYSIIQTKKGKKQYYTLIGVDKFDPFYQRKVLEVLHFDKDGKPIFGAPIFEQGEVFQHRVFYGFSNEAVMILRYDEQLKLIVLDHLAPQQKDQEGQPYNYFPDGSTDAFKWKRGKWIQLENKMIGIPNPAKR